MAALADGDRHAFAAVFEHAKPLVERYLATAVRDPAARDELVQATLVKLFERAHDYDPERDAATWIIALASWEVRSHRRDAVRAKARFASGDAAIDAMAAGDPERQLAERDALRAMAECLGELSPTDREVLRAAWGGERPAGATFRKRLERALGRLRLRWSARHGQDLS